MKRRFFRQRPAVYWVTRLGFLTVAASWLFWTGQNLSRAAEPAPPPAPTVANPQENAAMSKFTAAATPAPPVFFAHERVVVLGDSLSDGHTWPLLLTEALRQAQLPVPRFINAAIGGNTYTDMLARLDRDVFPYQPELVVLNGGGNDAARLTPEEGEASLQALLTIFHKRGVPVLLLTTPPGKNPDYDIKRSRMRQIILAQAEKFQLPVADTGAEVQRGLDAGEDVHEADGAHLNAQGYRRYVRAILDGLGLAEVAVPAEIPAPPIAGLVTAWRIHPLEKKQDPTALDSKSPQWANLTLPMPQPAANWWLDQERRRGFAVELSKFYPPASSYAALAIIPPAPLAEMLCLLGAEVQQVWVNGELQFTRPAEYQGWHIGGYRFKVALKTNSPNTLLLTANNAFALVLVDPAWEMP